jgi:hypothetical protein
MHASGRRPASRTNPTHELEIKRQVIHPFSDRQNLVGLSNILTN